MYSSSQEYKKRFTQNSAGSIPIGMPIACSIVTFPTSRQQFSIKWFPPFVFFFLYAALLWDNLIKYLYPPLKAKSRKNESLDFSLSFSTFVYDVEKSYVSCNRFDTLFDWFYLMIEWWGQNFVRPKIGYYLIRI